LIRQFAPIADITLLAFSDRDPATVDPGPLLSLCERVEILGHPTWRGRWNMLAALPQRTPFQVAYYRSDTMSALLNRLQAESFDVVFGQLFRTWPYLKGFRHPRTVIDLTDSLTLNLERAIPNKSGLKRLAFGSERDRVARYEVEVMNAVTESWVVSDIDREDLAARAPGATIAVVPNGLDDRWGAAADPARSPANVLLLGDMTVGHNIDMVSHLLGSIWPQVASARPTARLVLVGRTGPTVERLARRPGVALAGFVEDLRPLLGTTRVAVAPLRYGAGVQNKVLDTMMAGLPVIVTPLANEAIGGVPGVHLDVAPNDTEFAARIIAHLDDPARAGRMGHAARQFVASRFRWETAGERLRHVLDA
jgi:glycosyltransferase involved in cell wall biosynthesis